MARSSTKRAASRSLSRPAMKRSLQFPRRSVVLAAPTVGLGTSATTVLRTSFFANCVAAAGTGVFTGFLSPGSAFDPCGDQAAIQPQMFDQFSAQYQRYKVNSAIVHLKITGAASTGAETWHAAAYPAVDSTALATYQAAASQQYAKTVSDGFQTHPGAGTRIGIGANGKMLSFKLNHNAIVGNQSDAYDSGALVTANPTTNQFMVLPFFIQANSAGASTYVIEVDIWQNVTFSQKKNVIDA